MSTKKQGCARKERGKGGSLSRKALAIMLSLSMAVMVPMTTASADPIVAPADGLVEYGAAPAPADAPSGPLGGPGAGPGYGGPGHLPFTIPGGLPFEWGDGWGVSIPWLEAPEAPAAADPGSGLSQASPIRPFAPPPAGAFDIGLPLGGGTIDPSDTGRIVIIGEGAYQSFAGTDAGLDSALAALAACAPGDYVLYIGTTSSFALSTTAQNSGFMLGNVSTLVITGKNEVPSDVPALPQPALLANTGIGLLGSGQAVNFGCNVVLRNIRYNLGPVYMNGYDLTLGHMSWATTATSYYGGKASGTLAVPARNANGSADMTVWSTGNGTSTFVGGMRTGTLQGDVSITVNNTSGNRFDIWGAGYGTDAAAANRAHLEGSATTTVTNIPTSGSGGLGSFVGGVYYGNVTGRITNTVKGPGRLASTSNHAAWDFLHSQIIGGSYNGDIGTNADIREPIADMEATRTQWAYSDDYIIKNEIDTSSYTSGRTYFCGANATAGTVKGNVINIAKAGPNGVGSFSNFNGLGGANVATFSYSGFAFDQATGKITGIDTAIASAENGFTFKVYGNVTSILRSGCFSNSIGQGYLRGAGYGGFIKGSAYTVVGSEGLVWKDNFDAGRPDNDITYMYSNTQTNQGDVTVYDITAGGGNEVNTTPSMFIVGNTTIVQKNVRARWTYGGTFGGSQVGDTRIELHRGIVDTLEGTGYLGWYHVGNSETLVYGGQVDWFLSGGGWGDNYQDGSTKVTVFDNPRTRMNGDLVLDTGDFDRDGDKSEVAPAVVINASMGGTYGIGTHNISGDSEVTVYGGDFTGTARFAPSGGFSTGPSNEGRIYGNGTMTADFRGNRYGFAIEAGDTISGGRRLNAGGNSKLGIDGNQEVTLNLFSDKDSSVDLNSLAVFGDAASNFASSNIGKITMNINMPGVKLGSVYATNHNNISGSGNSATLLRDVEINLVAADQIQGLSAGNGDTAQNASITNTVASNAAAQGKAARLFVGPQDMPANWDTASQGPWMLGNLETGSTADGYPHRINVAGNGITNFTEMTLNKRFLVAQTGDVKNGGAATAGNYGASYSQTGAVTLRAGKGEDASGFGVLGSGTVIVGPMAVQGEGEVYIQSPGNENQVITSNVSIPDQSELVWLKKGGLASAPALGNSAAVSTWFGQSHAYKVITIGPLAANADSLTPGNFRGIDEDTGRTYIGDSYIPSTGNGFGVALAGTFYKWKVVDGPDGASLGKVSHNIEGATVAKPAPGSHILVYGTSPAHTPTDSGSLAILTANIPGQVPWPQFSFIPDANVGEWVASLDVLRSDQYVNKVPASNPRLADSDPLNDGIGNYNEGEQSQADYDTEANRVRRWTAGTSNPSPTAEHYPPGRTPADLGNTNDAEHSFDMTVDYTFTAELDAADAVVRESDAAALFGDSGLTVDEKVQNVVDATCAAGRSFFDTGDLTEAKLADLAAPLGTDAFRQVDVTYRAGVGGVLEKTVKVTVIPDDALIDGPFALVARDAEVTKAKAHGITAQYQDTDAEKNLDTYTQAIVVDIGAGSVLHPALADAAGVIGSLNGAVAGDVVAPVGYSFTGSYTDAGGILQTASLAKDVAVTVTAGLPPSILINGNYDPATPVSAQDPSLTYQTDPLVIAVSSSTDELTEAELLAGVSAVDKEDGALGVHVLDMANVHIVKDAPSVTQVTYTVTDADDNTVTRTRAVVVQDPSIVLGSGYILQAKGFVIAKSAAAPSAVLAYSQAAAWRVDGSSDGVSAMVKDYGGFTNAAGTYGDIVIGVADNGEEVEAPQGPQRTVTAKVYADSQALDPIEKAGYYNGTNGPAYAITARHARMNIVDAQALQASPDRAATLAGRAQATTYKRTDWTNDTNAVLTGDGGFAGATLAVGQAFELTFAVAKEPGTAVTVILVIDNGNTPALVVPKMKEIGLGDAFPEGATGDTAPSYLQGVSASDVEDGSLTGGITHDSTVDPSVAGLYTVAYTVTDSEYNTATATGYVLVNDGSFSYDPGSEHAVQAYDFVQSLRNPDATWDDAEILALSYARAWDLSGEAALAVPPFVADDAEYTDALGEYSPIEISPAFQDAPLRPVKATVIDKDEIDQGKNGADPTDSATYCIAADHVSILVGAARHHAGLSDEVKAWLIARAGAKAWKALGTTAVHNVDVLANGLPDSPDPGEAYPVTFCPAGVPSLSVTVDFLVGGAPPVITFDPDDGCPLVIQKQSGSAAHDLTAAEVKDKMTVWDVQDDDLKDATTYLIDGSSSAAINTGVAGVHAVTYSVTDSDDMTTTATRAVVIDDGRYLIDREDGAIIGAKGFVVARAALDGTEAQAKALSRAEAYGLDGTALAVGWAGTPPDYAAGAEAGEYPVVWKAPGHTASKAVTAHVTDADAVFAGGPNDAYAMTARHFTVNLAQAAAMLGPGLEAALVSRADVQVIKLIGAAPDAAPYVASDGGFTDEQAAYPLSFGAKAGGVPVTTAPPTQVSSWGRVSQGDPPVLEASTPLEVWIGDPAAMPQGAITPADYLASGGLHGVSATDPEDDDITAQVSLTGTVDTAAPGLYPVGLEVEDSDNNVASASRVVAVNDGRYQVGDGRVLHALPFVARKADVTADPSAVPAELLARSHAALYDGTTGVPAVPGAVTVDDDGGYRPSPGDYPITVAAPDLPQGALERHVTGRVVDADVVAPGLPGPGGDVCYAYGSHLSLRLSEAQAILAAPDPQAALLAALEAGACRALPGGAIEDLVPVIVDDGDFAANVGAYEVSVSDAGGKASATLNVTVGLGNMPSLAAVPVPLEFPWAPGSAATLSRGQIMEGVEASDLDDGDLTGHVVVNPNAAGAEALPSIPLGCASVTKATYRVADSDGNTASASRAVIVNDGSIVAGGGHVLQARSFVIPSAEVAGDPAALVLSRSAAQAWTAQGDPAAPCVLDDGLISPAPGDYYPVLGVFGQGVPEKAVTARVLAEGSSGGNGEAYAIEAHGFRINLADAAALQALAVSDPAAYGAALLSRAGAKGYLRADGQLPAGGTPALARNAQGGPADGGLSTAAFPQEGDAAYPATVSVTFWIDEDHSASCTVEVTVSNGAHPWLTVPALKIVDLNSVFTEADYLAGVACGDLEDGALADPTLWHDAQVNTALEGTYEVNYTATDTEGNVTEAKGYVLVGSWEASGDYAVTAGSFMTTVDKVAGTPNRDALIFSLSHAQAVHVARDGQGRVVGLEPVAPVVKSDAGFGPVEGSYSPIRIGVGASPAPVKDVTGRVVDKEAASSDPDGNGAVNDKNTDDPTDTGRYAVAANNVMLTWAQAGQLEGKADAATKAALASLAAAEAFRITPAGVFSPHTVDVSANGIRQENGSYDVTFVPRGVGGVSVTVAFTVDWGTPPVITVDGPLRMAATGSPATLSRAQLLQGNGVKVVDIESPELSDLSTVAISLLDTRAGSAVGAIDTSKAGVYQATYTVADPAITDRDTGMPLTVSAQGAVVIDDDRFIVDEDNETIIGAKDFVVSRKDLAFAGSAGDVLTRSFAEAYDFEGNALAVEVVGTLPPGFAARSVGTYRFTLRAVGTLAPVKAITGEVVDENTEVDRGEDPYNATYALVASAFAMDVADAAQVAGDAGLVQAASARAVGLVPSAPPASVVVHDNGGFTPRKGVYPITFGIAGVPQGLRSLKVDGTVTDGAPPALSVSTPLEMRLGEAWDKAKAMTGVLAADPGDGDITAKVSYFPAGQAKAVDTATPGIYPLTYTVTDSDGNTATASRVVVVNDGRYEVGKGRILEARPFVIRLQDVPANSNQVRPHLIAMTEARAYDGEKGTELSRSVLSLADAGGYSRTVGDYDVTVEAPDLPSGVLTKAVGARVTDADVIGDRPNRDGTAGSRVYVFGKNLTLRVSEAAAITDGSALLRALKAEALISDPASGGITGQDVLVAHDGGFKARVGTYAVRVADVGRECEIALSVSVVKGAPPAIDPGEPIVVPYNPVGGTLPDSQKKGGAQASDQEDGDLTPEIEAKGPVPSNEPGVYPVTLKVVDADGNTAEARSAVVVDDGTFAYGDGYIVSAKDFTIAKASVDNAAKSAQVLSESKARAWRNDGTPVAVSVSDLGGYQDSAGQYLPRIAVSGQALNKAVTVTVTAPTARYRVTFDPNGGRLTGPSELHVQEPATTLAYLPSSPVREGHTFRSWSTSPQGDGPFTPDTPVTRDMTVYAQWEEIPEPTPPPVPPPAPTPPPAPAPAPTPPPVVNVYPPHIAITNPPAGGGNTYVSPTSPPATVVVQPAEASAGERDRALPVATPSKDVGPQPDSPAPSALAHWSLLNVCLVIASLLPALALLAKFIGQRRRRKGRQEPLIDPSQGPDAAFYQDAALKASLEAGLQGRGERRRSEEDGKGRPVSMPVLLIEAVVFVEGLVILLATQDFWGQMVATDEYSIPLSLMVLVQLAIPLAAARLKNRGRKGGLSAYPDKGLIAPASD